MYQSSQNIDTCSKQTVSRLSSVSTVFWNIIIINSYYCYSVISSNNVLLGISLASTLWYVRLYNSGGARIVLGGGALFLLYRPKYLKTAQQ